MKKFVALFALALAAIALIACGSSSSSSSSEETAPSGGAAKEETSEEGGKEAEGGSAGSAASLDIEANPDGNLEFVEKSATAKAGKVTVNFTNSSPVPHDVKIEDSSGEEIGGTEVISEGSNSAEVELEPGTYTYFCSIPGHREAGMEGTLTVK